MMESPHGPRRVVFAVLKRSPQPSRMLQEVVMHWSRALLALTTGVRWHIAGPVVHWFALLPPKTALAEDCVPDNPGGCTRTSPAWHVKLWGDRKIWHR